MALGGIHIRVWPPPGGVAVDAVGDPLVRVDEADHVGPPRLVRGGPDHNLGKLWAASGVHRKMPPPGKIVT